MRMDSQRGISLKWSLVGSLVVVLSALVMSGIFWVHGRLAPQTPEADRYLLAPATSAIDDSNIANAIQALDAQCMSKTHHAYFRELSSPSEFVFHGDQQDPLFINTVRIDQLGYFVYLGNFFNSSGTASVGAIVSGPSKEQQFVDSLSKRQRQSYSVAFSGSSTVKTTLQDGKTFYTSPGGCEGEAFGTIFGTSGLDHGILHYTKVFTLAQDIISGLGQRIASTSNFVRSMNSWSNCMTDAGFRFPTRNEAFANLVRKFQAHPGGLKVNFAREMKQAHADSRCVTVAKINRVSEMQTSNTVRYLTKKDIAALTEWWKMQLHGKSMAHQVLNGSYL